VVKIRSKWKEVVDSPCDTASYMVLTN